MGKTISGGASSGSRARKPSGGSAEFDMKNFREFEVEEMRLAYAGALDQLTKAERAAVSDYTGSAFGAINSVLRNEGFNPESFPNSNITKQVNAIDSALQRGTLQEGAILYRGFSANNITSALESGQLKPGMKKHLVGRSNCGFLPHQGQRACMLSQSVISRESGNSSCHAIPRLLCGAFIRPAAIGIWM